MQLLAIHGSMNPALFAKLRFLLPRHTRLNGDGLPILKDVVAFAASFGDLQDLDWLEQRPDSLKRHPVLRRFMVGRKRAGYTIDAVPLVLCIIGFVVKQSEWQVARAGGYELCKSEG